MRINLSDDSSDEGKQVTRHPLILDEAQILPSNQKAAAVATNHPQTQKESSDEEFSDGGLLTQFIGSGLSTVQNKKRRRTATEMREQTFKQELDKFYTKYLCWLQDFLHCQVKKTNC